MISTTDVTYFRPRRPGPEAAMEDVVAERISAFVSLQTHRWWTAGSLPIGAGEPDLVIASYQPQVFALANIALSESHLLAFLRGIGRAKIDTIAQRLRAPRTGIERRLYTLVEAQAVNVSADTFWLSPEWRDILPEIITVEVKVSNWQRAIEQAARNRIFAHRSFVALPANVALRVKGEAAFPRLGIGVLSVDDDVVTVLRRARRRTPSVWTYYYRIASLLAKDFRRN